MKIYISECDLPHIGFFSLHQLNGENLTKKKVCLKKNKLNAVRYQKEYFFQILIQ
jgi:hypothetical protein